MENARNGHYNFSTAELPLRVIHVEDTLANEHLGGICLVKPTNWDFHVLSHTWSQLIRDLSKDIGQLLMKKRSSSSRSELDVDNTAAYNQAFLKENFSGKDAYKDLVELLRLLREERVGSIWFDALCIDQTNDQEKQTEISRMAAYYANSQGCYVLMHGVGKGYTLWRPDSPKEIPRWFERVWTLQEFILPRSLTFIVEGLDDRVVSVVNELIAKGSPSDPSIGLCCCCIPSDLLERRPPSISAMCQPISAADSGGPRRPHNDMIRQCHNNRDVCCSTCRSKVLLRSTSKPAAPLELLHFVDREAFLLVARAALLMDTHGRWIKNWGYEQMLCSMYKLIERRPNPRQIISRVGERYCSVPEDRVLSILGVLGVQEGSSGAEQLRTGQTLDEQIVKAANLCNQDTIIELCATDAVGYYIQGMSWSPNFRDNLDRYIQGWMHAERASIILNRSWTSDIQWIRRKVEVLHPVTASGMRLRCRMAEAHITPGTGNMGLGTLHVGDSFMRLLQMSKWQHCLHSDDDRNPRPQVVSRVRQKNFKGIYMKDHMPWKVYHGFSTQIYLTVASELIPEDANGQELAVLGEFKVWLVQLGSVDVPESSSESGVELIMVCLGSSDHAAGEGGGEMELHKVGMLALESEEASKVFTQESSECVLGGFGQDLSKYLNIIRSTSSSSSTTTTTHLIQASGRAGGRCSSANQIISTMPLVHIPLCPIFEWTTTFVKISYPDAGEAGAYSGSDPIIFPYGIPIHLDLEAPHIKQLLHRYLMDRGSLPSGCPVGFGISGMSTIEFFFSSNRIRDGV